MIQVIRNKVLECTDKLNGKQLLSTESLKGVQL